MTSDLADNAVNNAKIIDTAVSTNKLANNAVTAPKLASMGATNGQVLKSDGTTRKPGADEVASGCGSNPVGPAGGDLAGTYTNPVTGDGKVTSAKVPDGTIANADLADNSVTSAKISDGTMANADLADHAVNSAKILDSSVAAADLANSAVTTDKLSDLAVSKDKIQNTAVTTDKRTNLSVTTDKLANNAVTVAKLPSGSTSDKFLRGDGTWALPSGIGLTLPWSGSTSHSGFGFAVTNSSASAIIGKATSASGEDYGLYGESMSVSGSGVYGKSPTYGVYGEAVRTTGTASIYGIFGKTDDSKGYGVYGQGLNGGIYGVSSAETGLTYGIVGTTLSPDGTGASGSSAYRGMYGNASGYKGRTVMGEATGTSGIGVQGLSTNTGSTGVWGEGSNQGVYGLSEMATGKGVFGQVTSSAGYPGYFDGGKFYVSGNTGTGTTSPAKKLHDYGSAQVKDTLFANVVNASKVTINVPASGYILLISSSEFQSLHNSGDETCLHLGVSKKSDGTGIKELPAWLVFIENPTDVIHTVISEQAVLQVTSTGTQTFYFMGYRISGTDTDEVYRIQRNLTAIYFPVAYGTVE